MPLTCLGGLLHSAPRPSLAKHPFGVDTAVYWWAAFLHGTQHNFRVMQVLLHRFIKSAHVYTIHDSMMSLHV